jgi:hypothetical protein
MTTNIQTIAQGFSAYLDGILPTDVAYGASAFSVSMLQIKNIQQMEIQKLGTVAYTLETTKNLNINGTGTPTNIDLSNNITNSIAKGNGPYSTYTMSNFLGCMSGLPYMGKFQTIQNLVNSLSTDWLRRTYEQLYLAVTWKQATATVTINVYNVLIQPYDPVSGAPRIDYWYYTITGGTITDPGGGYGRERTIYLGKKALDPNFPASSPDFAPSGQYAYGPQPDVNPTVTLTEFYTPSGATLEAVVDIDSSNCNTTYGQIINFKVTNPGSPVHYDSTVVMSASIPPTPPVTTPIATIQSPPTSIVQPPNYAQYNDTTYTSGSGIYTVPPGVNQLNVTIVGAGGGGGGCSGNEEPVYVGGGGGGGQVINSVISVTPGQQIPWSVGTVGTGGAVGNDGTNGGTTTFGSLNASGGGGGNGSNGTGGTPNGSNGAYVSLVNDGWDQPGGAGGHPNGGGGGLYSENEYGDPGINGSNGSITISGWPQMNNVIQNYINRANTEILGIKMSNIQDSNTLNQAYNDCGSYLALEQRTRASNLTKLPPQYVLPRETTYSSFPTTPVNWVDSVPTYSINTDPNMYAQTIEAISDNTLGGQSLIGLMRENRNQARLNVVGISLDNNINDTLSTEQQRQNLYSGNLPAGDGTLTPPAVLVTEFGSAGPHVPPIPNAYNLPNDYGNGPIPPNLIVKNSQGGIVGVGALNKNPYLNIIPSNLNTTYTQSTLSSGVYSVKEAIDQVTICNCSCWDNL